MISANGLDVRAPDGRILLKGLSFKLSKGDRLAFSGPNGCGKSTLLRYVAGLEGEDADLQRSVSLTDTTYLPTRPLDLLLPWGSVAENVKLFSSVAKNRNRQPSNETLYNCFTTLGYDLSRLSATEVYKLSSGQQAVLAIYCALIQQPMLLVADEIFSTLSEELRVRVADRLKQIGLTIICATHDSGFIKHLDAIALNLDSYIPLGEQQ